MRKYNIHCPSGNGAWVKLDHAPYPCEHSKSMAVAKTHTVLGRRMVEHNGLLLGLIGGDKCLVLDEHGNERSFSDSWTAAEWFVGNA